MSQFQFEWDETKAAANALKHGVTFEVASTVFRDPQLLTVAFLWPACGRSPIRKRRGSG
jgi:uncharacterized DUF497 family protein